MFHYSPSSNFTISDGGLTVSQISLLVMVFPLMSITILGNLLVILSWFVSPGLRTPSNFLLVALAIVDLLLGCTLIPMGSIYMFYGKWVFGGSSASKIFCQIQLSSTFGLSFLSANHLVLIAADRYRVLFDGMTYLGRRKLRHALESVALLWVLGAWIVSPIWLDWNNAVVDPGLKEHCLAKNSYAWLSLNNLGTFIFPMFYLARLYFGIFLELRRRFALKMKIGEHWVSNASQPVSSKLAATQLASISFTYDCFLFSEVLNEPSSNTMGKIYAISSPKLPSPVYTCPVLEEFRNNRMEKVGRRERKAAITLGVLIGAFYISWLPTMSLSMIDLCWYKLPEQMFYISGIMGWINSAINPIVYATKNPEFKAAFRKIVG